MTEPQHAPGGSSPVTVPGIIMDFLERASVGVVGTRDDSLVPHVHRISGWRLEPDRRSMTCLFADAFRDHLVESLESNGVIAVTIEEIGPHETYQFKGRYRSSRPCDEDDQRLYRQIRERFAKVLSGLFGFEQAACRNHMTEPTLAVTFEIDEIFLQTPGPGAGRRLVPREES